MAFVRRVVAEAGRSEEDDILLGGSLDLMYPAVSEYLVTRAFEDGSERIRSTVLVFAEDGVWKVCLNDRQNERSLWAAGQSIKDAFEALETIIASGAGVWRRSLPGGRRKSK